MPKKNLFLFVVLGGAAFLGYRWYSKRKTAAAPPKFFMAARWDNSKLLGNQCWSVEQNAWVDKALCGGDRRK